MTSSDHQRDENIQYPHVRLVDPETGQLRELAPLQEVMKLYDRKTHFLELVSANPDPVVKIIDKKEDYAKRKALQKAQRAQGKGIPEKEIQLTWSVASGDLQHKLRKVREELEKGHRINLVFAPKKGQPLPSPQQMAARADETVAMLAQLGTEWKSREVQRHTTVIYLQGARKN